MKTKLFSIIGSTLIAGTILLPNQSYADEQAIKVFINGEQLNFEVSPVIQNGTTLVPLRIIFEKFGYNVSWHPENQSILGLKDGVGIQMNIGNNQAYVRGKAFTLEVPPTIINGNTLVPLRFISEASGNAVSWDGDTKSIYIGDKSQVTKEPVVTTGESKDTYYNVTWGTSETAIKAKKTDKPVLERINNNGYKEVIYNQVLEGDDNAKLGYTFDESGLREITYLSSYHTEFDDIFGIYTLLDMDRSYLYNNGKSQDEFNWKVNDTRVSAYKKVYGSNYRGMAEMGIKQKELDLIAQFTADDAYVHILLTNMGSTTKPEYMVALSYVKK